MLPALRYAVHLVDFVLRLTKCKEKYDGIDNDRERSRIVDQILLQISRGGLGIQCSEDVINNHN